MADQPNGPVRRVPEGKITRVRTVVPNDDTGRPQHEWRRILDIPEWGVKALLPRSPEDAPPVLDMGEPTSFEIKKERTG